MQKHFLNLNRFPVKRCERQIQHITDMKISLMSQWNFIPWCRKSHVIKRDLTYLKFSFVAMETAATLICYPSWSSVSSLFYLLHQVTFHGVSVSGLSASPQHTTGYQLQTVASCPQQLPLVGITKLSKSKSKITQPLCTVPPVCGLQTAGVRLWRQLHVAGCSSLEWDQGRGPKSLWLPRWNPDLLNLDMDVQTQTWGIMCEH